MRRGRLCSLLAGLVIGLIVGLVPAGTAYADGTPTPPNEAYPPAATVPTTTPAPAPGALPRTGASGIDIWLRAGAAALIAGVALVAVAERRRRHATIRA